MGLAIRLAWNQGCCINLDIGEKRLEGGYYGIFNRVLRRLVEHGGSPKNPLETALSLTHQVTKL